MQRLAGETVLMIIATHQPVFLPWSGFFIKALKADCVVLLDGVQFPRGRGWMTRNRLKCDQGELLLTVPVHRKGRGLQIIHDVQLIKGTGWKKKHLRSIEQWYAHAPYLDDYSPMIRQIYGQGDDRLLSLNLRFILFLWDVLGFKTHLVLQSELGVTGRGTELILRICERLGAKRYFTFPMAAKYLDSAQMGEGGVELSTVVFYPPVYPQLWGKFIPNLSALDLLLNCGSKSLEILSKT